MSVVDDSKTFTVVLLTAQAKITRIVVSARGYDYDVYPGGQTAYATFWDTVVLHITVKNTGLAGELNCIVREGATTLASDFGSIVPAGGSITYIFALDMPNRDWTLTVDVGH